MPTLNRQLVSQPSLNTKPDKGHTSKVAPRNHPIKRLLREHHLREVRQVPGVRDGERPVDLETRANISDYVDLWHTHATQRLDVPQDRQTLRERDLCVNCPDKSAYTYGKGRQAGGSRTRTGVRYRALERRPERVLLDVLDQHRLDAKHRAPHDLLHDRLREHGQDEVQALVGLDGHARLGVRQ